MSQTAVSDNLAVASPGDIGDFQTSANDNIKSAVNEEATASIVIGTMVKLGTAAGLVKKLTDSHEAPWGIVTRAHAYSEAQIESLEVDTDVFFDALKPGAPMGIGRHGEYAVIIEEDVDFDDPVHVRAVAVAGEIAGAFGKTDGAADTILLGNAHYCGAYTVDADTGFGVAKVWIGDGFDTLAVTDS